MIELIKPYVIGMPIDELNALKTELYGCVKLSNSLENSAGKNKELLERLTPQYKKLVEKIEKSLDIRVTESIPEKVDEYLTSKKVIVYGYIMVDRKPYYIIFKINGGLLTELCEATMLDWDKALPR
jgi:hypothetical protein